MWITAARYYDPSVGRFLQQDPDPGKLMNPISVINRYKYSYNNPINFRDPTGRFEVVSAIIAVAISATLEGINNWANGNQSWEAFSTGIKKYFHYGYKPLLSFLIGGFSADIKDFFVSGGKDAILDEGSYLFTKVFIGAAVFDAGFNRSTTSQDERTFWMALFIATGYYADFNPNVDYSTPPEYYKVPNSTNKAPEQ